MDPVLDMLRQTTARLLDLADRRRGGADIKWRLEALKNQLEHEIDKEQHAIYERPRAGKEKAA